MIAIIHTVVSHYREAFFEGLAKSQDFDIYCFLNQNETTEKNFKVSDYSVKDLWKVSFGKFVFYSLTPFFNTKYDTIVLMWNFGHISSWILLLTKIFHKKKLILWGHGISVRRYLKEEKSPDFLLKLMAYFADGLWVYMEKEELQWKEIFPKKQIVGLNNTISEVDSLINLNFSEQKKSDIKQKYKITNDLIFIYCARFNNDHRRPDLLLKIVQLFSNSKFGFIIIGSGPSKPDFTGYSNVYEFGSIYDRNIKDELFCISDIYVQPGWVGLSIVEAMAYGKPIATFKRSETILQCVEYSLIDSTNGFLFNDIQEMFETLTKVSSEEIKLKGENSRNLVKNKVTMQNMVDKAISIL